MIKMINNRYKIIEKIGAGGMADVYLALDTVLNREVAIKTLRGDLSNNPVALLRFKREANAGSGLNHPNIVEVYDVGEYDNVQYIVMEYVKGPTAKELIFRRGSLELKESVDFMLQLSYGISKAHAQGIVHRDIKPQNILVKSDGTLKVSDFGIAQAEDALQLTKVDSVMGSVHYLAPEIVRGEGASFQSDIYAMGIIFYEILTGKPPFEGDMPVEIAMKQLKDPVPSVKDFNPNIPNSIVNIINKATAKNISNRYKTVDEMIRDLQSALSDARRNETLWEPILPAQDETIMIDTLEEVKKEPKKNKLTKKKKIIIGSLVTILIIGLVSALVLNGKQPAYQLDDLRGLTLEEAKEVLAPHNIHIISRSTHEFSQEYEKGQIMETSPKEGTEVEKGSQISVVISKGKFFEIGDYIGEDISIIKPLLEDNTRMTVRVVYEYKKGVEPGIITKQEGPQKGEKISPDQDIDIVLTVSTELEIQIPNINNIDVEDAKKQLETQGIRVELEAMDLSNFTKFEIEKLNYNVVIRTNPMMGSSYVQKEDNFVTIYYYDRKDIPVFEEETPQDNETGDVNAQDSANH